MKGFLIDPKQKSITEVEHDDSLKDLHKQLECNCIDAIRINEAGDTLYIDDNGLYDKRDFFGIGRYPSPIAGRGLVLGADSEGRSISPQATTIETLENYVHFISPATALIMAEDSDKIVALLNEGKTSVFTIPAADIIREYSDSPKQGE